jgi:thiamine biosynthesis protein ThiS
MQLQFNDQLIETEASCLGALLEENGLSGKTGIAVAVNDAVIRRAGWEHYLLKENDTILVITAAAGG